MSPAERELLTRFLEQLTTAQAGQKDADAERLIRDAVARQPDAAYLLVQRALQLDQAFQAAQAQATQLQTELDRTRTSGSSFLNDPNAWGSRPHAAAAPAAAQQSASAGPARAGAAPPPARPSPWGTNLLGTMATTAAGVVAGSFLYQGIQGLMNRNEAGASGDRTHTAAADSPHTSGPLEEAPTDTYAEGFDDSIDDVA